jgi:hypothetical protein
MAERAGEEHHRDFTAGPDFRHELLQDDVGPREHRIEDRLIRLCTLT